MVFTGPTKWSPAGLWPEATKPAREDHSSPLGNALFPGCLFPGNWPHVRHPEGHLLVTGGPWLHGLPLPQHILPDGATGQLALHVGTCILHKRGQPQQEVLGFHHGAVAVVNGCGEETATEKGPGTAPARDTAATGLLPPRSTGGCQSLSGTFWLRGLFSVPGDGWTDRQSSEKAAGAHHRLHLPLSLSGVRPREAAPLSSPDR